MDEYEIKYDDLNLLIVGEYEAGEKQEHDYIGSAQRFIIGEVFIKENNIFNLLSNTVIEELETKILNKHY